MKSPFVFTALIINTLCYSQDRASPPQSNPFSEADKSSVEVGRSNPIEEEAKLAVQGDPSGPPVGGDPEPVPIDNQVPYLVLGGMAFIFYATYNKKKNTLRNKLN